MSIVCFVLVGVGVVLILLGAYISLEDWKKKQDAKPVSKDQGLVESLKGLAKLADALKGYPLGQQLIVWGIVIVIIGGLFGGVSGFMAGK